MADEQPDAQVEEKPGEARGLFGRLRDWAAGDARRGRLVGFGLVAAGIVTVASWLTLAEIAADPDPPSIERALEALDAGDDALAAAIIDRFRDADDLDAKGYGGAFFVLGALKAREAERQWSPERSRSDHLVASRYLGEARAIGFPEGRGAQGLFLLGKSLIASRQLEDGIEALRWALDAGARGESAAHLLLAEAYFSGANPDYQQTVTEIDAALSDETLSAAERDKALLMRTEALAAAGLGDEAAETFGRIGPDAPKARRALAGGKAAIAKLEQAPGDGSLANAARVSLERARRLDKLSTSVSRESDYLMARVAEITGQTEDALARFRELRRRHGSSPAGVAAALGEAAILQDRGEADEALNSLRRAIDAIGDARTYENSLLPLEEVRRRVRLTHRRFLNNGSFEPALTLVDWVGRLLGREEQLELRAMTLRQWGDAELAAAAALGPRGNDERRRGRRRLREAGVAYEQLAESRYATRRFTDDLWTAAETLHEGQAYRDAIRVLQRYLRHEPVDRNALALLRMGEAHLAGGADGAAIAAFEECLEFHPSDASSYRARLRCAVAYRERGEVDRAEEFLRHNLTRTQLSPASPEWRDSKFALGQLLAAEGRHDEAIRELEEAVQRYPDAAASRSARYAIADAHRHAAHEPLQRLREANTVNEREDALSDAREHLEAALEMYRQVEQEITLANSGDELDRVTRRNCYVLGGEVLFELGNYEEGRYEEAIQSFSRVSTLYQNEPYMLEALLQIHHCWRRLHDRPKALGVIQQARLLLDRLPPDTDFANSTTLSRAEWDRLLGQLAAF